MNYLIDTNVIFELIKLKPDKNVISWFGELPAESLHLSVLTLGEIRKGISKIADSGKKEKLRIWVEHELPAWFSDRILPVDTGVADRWGRLLSQYKQTLPAIDSLIAATALHSDLCLVTRNNIDFNMFTELQLINPWNVMN